MPDKSLGTLGNTIAGLSVVASAVKFFKRSFQLSPAEALTLAGSLATLLVPESVAAW